MGNGEDLISFVREVTAKFSKLEMICLMSARSISDAVGSMRFIFAD